MISAWLLAAVMMAPDKPPAVVAHRGETYALVEGAALRSALPGHSIRDQDCRDTAGVHRHVRCRRTFVHHVGRPRAAAHGSYVIQRDRYCMRRATFRWCKALYRARDGRYSVMTLGSDTAEVSPVLIADWPTH